MAGLALLCVSSWAEDQAVTPVVVAVVAGRDITVEQVQAALLGAEPGPKSTGSSATAKKQVLDRLVRQELLYAAARQEGYEQRPEIRAALRQLIIDRYSEEKLVPRLKGIVVSEAAVTAYYRDHAADFSVPEARRAALIEVKVPLRAPPETRKGLRQRAEQARREAVALAAPTFAGVAVAYSDDQASRYRGGEIGWQIREQPRSRRDPAVLEALFVLDTPGAVSPVLVTAEGFALVKLLEVRERALRPLAEVAAQIRRRLQEQQKEQLTDEFFRDLQQHVPVTVDEQVLAEIALPPATNREILNPPPLPGR